MLGDALLALLDTGDAGDAMLSQIQSALATTPPPALQRAAGLYVWKRTWESRSTASRHGGDRKSTAYRQKDQGEKISFWSVASEATGVGERQIQLDLALADDLGPTDIRRFWTSPIAANAAALRTVAALDTRGRDRLAEIWSDNPKLTFGAAMQAAKLRQDEDADETAFQRMVDLWARAGSKARRRFLTEIGIDARAAEAAVIAARKGGAN